MEIKLWEAINTYICKGLLSIKNIVKGNSDWWMIEVFNGFGDHLLSLKVMVRSYNKSILDFKEEENSSHANKLYAKYVAKEDKNFKTREVCDAAICESH